MTVLALPRDPPGERGTKTKLKIVISTSVSKLILRLNKRRTISSNRQSPTLYYAIVLPGRISNFRAGFRPDSHRKSVEIGPPACRRPRGPILRLCRLESKSLSKPDITKPQMPGAVPTNRHKPSPIDFGPISGSSVGVIFNRFPAKLGPKTPPDGSGSTNGEERT